MYASKYVVAIYSTINSGKQNLLGSKSWAWRPGLWVHTSVQTFAVNLELLRFFYRYGYVCNASEQEVISKIGLDFF